MKRHEAKGMTRSDQTDVKKNHQIITRLDESLPLETEEWRPIEQMLARLTEFAPNDIINQLSFAIVSFADDQARRGYILGQQDLALEIKRKVA